MMKKSKKTSTNRKPLISTTRGEKNHQNSLVETSDVYAVRHLSPLEKVVVTLARGTLVSYFAIS